MSSRFLKVQAFVVASTLSIAMLLFAARKHEPVTAPQFRNVIDLTSSASAQQTTLLAPARLGGAWTVDSLPATRLVAPLAIIQAQHKNFPDSESLVTMDDVASYERLHGPIPQGAMVLLSSVKENAEPTLNSDALHFLAEARNIVAIGGAATFHSSSDESSYLAQKGIYELNNVANVSLVPPYGVVAVAAPQLRSDAQEAPVRLMALLK